LYCGLYHLHQGLSFEVEGERVELGAFEVGLEIGPVRDAACRERRLVSESLHTRNAMFKSARIKMGSRGSRVQPRNRVNYSRVAPRTKVRKL